MNQNDAEKPDELSLPQLLAHMPLASGNLQAIAYKLEQGQDNGSISRIALAAALRRNSYYMDRSMEQLVASREEVKELKTQLTDQWVAVTERLPERRQFVICRCVTRNGNVQFLTVLWLHNYPDVTHWKPFTPIAEDIETAGRES